MNKEKFNVLLDKTRKDFEAKNDDEKQEFIHAMTQFFWSWKQNEKYRIEREKKSGLL